MYLGIGETRGIRVQFDPAYRDDAHIRIAEDDLLISYKEHPHMVNLYILINTGVNINLFEVGSIINLFENAITVNLLFLFHD